MLLIKNEKWHSIEMLLRQALSSWISFVAEYAQEDTTVDIQVEPQGQSCLFTIRSTGKKTLPPPECDLTLYGYIASRIMELLHADLRRAEENEGGGALIQFALPVA